MNIKKRSLHFNYHNISCKAQIANVAFVFMHAIPISLNVADPARCQSCMLVLRYIDDFVMAFAAVICVY